MTTITVRDGVMASDSRADGEYIMTVEKIHRLPDGGVIGGSGTASILAAVIHWIANGATGEPPSKQDDDCYFLLLLKPDGTIWRAENNTTFFRILDPFAATGSGSNFAMAAMELGASAAEAVRVAARYDSGTGGKVRTLAVPKRKS